MTIKQLNRLERELSKKCPKASLFEIGTLYTVRCAAAQWRGKIEEEVFDSAQLRVQFVLNLVEDVKKWVIREINEINYKEYLD